MGGIKAAVLNGRLAHIHDVLQQADAASPEDVPALVKSARELLGSLQTDIATVGELAG